VFNFHHPYIGALPAVVVLASAWTGVYLCHPEALWSVAKRAATPVRTSAQGSNTAMETAG